MASTRVSLTLLVTLTLGFALPVAAQPLSGPEYTRSGLKGGRASPDHEARMARA